MAEHLLRPTPGEVSDCDSTVEEWLCVPAPQRAVDRLRIYRDGYPARIADAVTEAYPAIARLLGEEEFGALAHRYAASVPLTSYNLNDAGAPMAEFLRGDPVASEWPFLPDLAALEWRVALAFHAAERSPLDPRTLAWSMEEWAGAVLHFQPSVAVVSSPWPILVLWAAEEAPDRLKNLDVHRRPNDIIIRRVGLVVRCEPVSPPEALALRLLLEGHCLAETTARLEAVNDDPDAVMAWFSRWASAGMIAAAVASDQQ